MKVKDYKEVIVWQKGVEIVDRVYQLASRSPQEERYCLTAQMQRSAVSIPLNIAEGFVREHAKSTNGFVMLQLAHALNSKRN